MYRCKANKLWNLKLTINFASFVLVGKHKPLNAKISILTKLPVFVLPQTPKLSGLYHSGDDRLFPYFFWLHRKFLLKLDNRKFSDCHYSMGHHKKSFLIFVKASHTLMHFYLTNMLTMFH